MLLKRKPFILTWADGTEQSCNPVFLASVNSGLLDYSGLLTSKSIHYTNYIPGMNLSLKKRHFLEEGKDVLNFNV